MPISDETKNLIFDKLKKNLEKYAPPMAATYNANNPSYELIGNKPVPYGYNKKIIPGMFFASIAYRKDSVTFHFFPSYMNTELKEVAPSLYNCLKGKTCFHFKQLEQINEEELNALLAKGLEAWKKAGYMN
jgi:hypothetical protein